MALPPHASVLANADVWMESEAVEQLARTAGKPGCVRAVGMPDLHPGRGIPIGAVFLFDGRVFPELVGGDAGCGVLLIAGRKDGPRGDALERRVLAALDEPMLPDVDPAALVACAWERGPRGLAALSGVPEALGELALRAPDDAHERASGALPDGTRHAEQLGTVGGGNHFAEISRVDQLADKARAKALAVHADAQVVMVHSGSRGLGPAIRDHHEAAATRLRGGLRGLAADGPGAAAYLHDMRWALDYAELSRTRLLERACEVLADCLGIRPGGEAGISCHHNFVRREQHGGQWLWVHRKGAISAAEGEPGVIPGSMGTSSYHVLGRGHPASLCSSSHGAGRCMPRGEARRRIAAQELLAQLRGVWFDHRAAEELRDEAPAAYKDIGAVMRAQRELTRVVRRLRPVLSFKAAG